jgi:hypothetical protein
MLYGNIKGTLNTPLEIAPKTSGPFLFHPFLKEPNIILENQGLGRTLHAHFTS